MPTAIHPIDGGAPILVGKQPILVGRHPACDTRLDSYRVSRRHCALVEIDGAVIVRDLGSTNGTWINGQRVTWGWLQAGDELAIAEHRYRVNANVDAAPANQEMSLGTVVS